jgi:HPt (histidine-containing phosphotransfer) domain-containing protein
LDGIREIQAPGEADLFTEMTEAFFEDAPAQLAQITDAVVRSDAESLAGAAHALKSGAGYLGARELQRLCTELENLGRSGTIDGAQAMAEPLRITFEQTRRALHAELGRQNASV